MQPSSTQFPSHNHLDSNHSPIRSILPLKRSDLGSDDEWQLTMGSDSDLDDPEQSPPNPPSVSSHTTDLPSSNLNPRVQSRKSLEHTDPNHINQPVLPHPNNPSLHPHSSHQQSYHQVSNLALQFNQSLHLSDSSKQQHHPEPAPIDHHDDSHHDQIVLIPGYRGSSSRHAVANHPSSSSNPIEAHPSSSTHSNRANPVPLTSSQPCTYPSPPQIPLSNQLQPAQSPTSTSTHEKQQSNSTSLHPTKQSQSVHNTTRPLSADLYRKPTDKPLLQQQHIRTPTTNTSTPTPDAIISDSGRNGSSRTSGIRATLRDSTARLTAARLSASSRQFQPHSHAPDLNQDPNSNLYYQRDPSRNLFVPLRQSPQYHIDATAVPRYPGYNYMNAIPEEDLFRVKYDLEQASIHLGGTSNPALYATPANFGTPGASSSFAPMEAPETLFPSSVEPSHLPTHAGPLQPATKSTKDLSFLECIVEILKGCAISKRKYLLSTLDGEIWLTSNLKTVQYRIFKKGHPSDVQSVLLDDVLLVRGSERELTLEVIDRKKPLQFIFQTQARSETWLSALSCMVPSHTIVMLRHKKLEMREPYDPMKDIWNGKPVASKKQLKEYIILGTIGRGSFAKVKLALSRVNRGFYALKVIYKKDMLRKMGLFLRRAHEGRAAQLTSIDVHEIDVMRNLRHDNVIRYYNVYDAPYEERIYIALEFLSRGPIMRSTRLVSRHRMSENKARSAFVDVLGGLQYLHSKNIVHGDIKPDNLLQAGNGTVKISDFGAAIKYSGDTASQDAEEAQYRQTNGTPAFSAPEICLSEHSPPCPARCFAADIWSLGATLYYLVVGQVPFPAPTIFQIYEVICTEPLRFPNDCNVSKNLKSLLQQMMQKSPEQRATFASIVESPWLTENREIEERLSKIKDALLKQSNGTSTETRPGLQSGASVPPR